MGNMNLVGRDGRTVEGYYAERGGPTAYLGTCIPGFPNAFTLLGAFPLLLCCCFIPAMSATRCARIDGYTF